MGRRGIHVTASAASGLGADEEIPEPGFHQFCGEVQDGGAFALKIFALLAFVAEGSGEFITETTLGKGNFQPMMHAA